jgi:hypothetical protein
MSITPTQQALRALSRTEFVVMSTRTQRTTVSDELSRKFAPVVVEGETPPMPDWEALQDFHAGLLERSAAEVRQTDQQHRANKAVISGYRRQRQTLVGGLKVQYRDLRKSVEGAYGEAGLVAFGIESPPPRRFVAVHEQMRELLALVHDPEFPALLPELKAGQTPTDHLVAHDQDICEPRALVDVAVESTMGAETPTTILHSGGYLWPMY